MIRANIHYRTGHFELDAAFELYGGITAVAGPSGAGKTTLLRLLAGRLRPTGGYIQLVKQRIYDQAQRLWVPAHRRRVGLVEQSPALLPHLTVAQNVDYGRQRVPDPLSTQEVATLAEHLDITALGARYPATLSGGEIQRTALVQALATRPALLLLDEPTSALDPVRRRAVIRHLRQLHHLTGVPVIVSSHDWVDIMRLADRAILLEDGKIRVMGDVNWCRGHVEAPPEGVQLMGKRSSAGLVLSLGQNEFVLPAKAATAGDREPFFLAADDVMIARNRPEGLSATIIAPATISTITAPADGFQRIDLHAGDTGLMARLTAQSVDRLALKPGLDVYVVIKSAALTDRR